MERQRPDTTSNEIDLYIRTYYSLLRSSGEVRVRSFEEAHIYSDSSLHEGARHPAPDISAFGYAAARLPDCMPAVRRIVLGQSEEQFERAGYEVRSWQRVRARGRRRPFRYDGNGLLAAFIASASDIDDLVPIVTAYQIEWNKIHFLLATTTVGQQLAQGTLDEGKTDLEGELADAIDLSRETVVKLRAALAADYLGALSRMVTTRSDLRMQLLAGSFVSYQRAAQRWWSGIEPVYRPDPDLKARARPVYFVSSNTHSLANLLGGYVMAHREALMETARKLNPDGVWAELERASDEGAEGEVANLLNFVLRSHVHAAPDKLDEVQRWDGESGITTVPDPGHVEVGAQVIELDKLIPQRFDPRIRVPGVEKLAKSDAVIVNIDYPLGMAAYQLLSRLGQGVDSLRGVYLMGKAATLNARVGDVIISKVVQDEHSKNTYIVSNAFTSGDVAPYLNYGTVFDNQKALTVRSAFLQNRQYMGVFYREGYTVMEMEAGPYMSAIYELVDPRRHPNDELVYLSDRTPFDVGILHYSSDTPYSRRQSLLSKSMGFFGMDSTYACAVAIVRRILGEEIARL